MKKTLLLCFCVVILLAMLGGCAAVEEDVKIGVALGVSEAVRWEHEKVYMEDYAETRGAEIEVKLNKDLEANSFKQDCYDLIDSGIQVLIIKPHDTTGVGDVVEYAKKNGVKIVSYMDLIENEEIDTFIGYDCVHIGGMMGRYLAETVPKGDYILLSGDTQGKSISAAADLYNGAMDKLSVVMDDINIVLDTSVENWSVDVAKKLVKEAVENNNKNIDAILVPNDAMAGICAEALAELDIRKQVAITGMGTELEAVKRIAAGTQSCTVFMELEIIARAAVDMAIDLVEGGEVRTNAQINNGSGKSIPANLIPGKLVTKNNIDRIFINNNRFEYEEIYGEVV